ncbi:MAG: hypothetical protein LBE89_04140 [Helicobacteraceae bacterium]|jgi:hypothetical protein|nr:hypothetical protein [Helicobacteraceae bacterium]
MKVLVILYDNDFNDTVWHALNLAALLYQNGNDIRVALKSGSPIEGIIKSRKLPIEHVLAEKQGFFSQFAQSDMFKALQSRFPPDVVLCYGGKPKGIKHFKQAKTIGVVTDFHSGLWAKKYKYLIASSQAIKTELSTFISQDNISVLYGNVERVDALKREETRKKLRKEFGFSEKNVVIGIIGRIDSHSGHDLLFQAISSDYHPNIKLFAFVESESDSEAFRQIGRKYNFGRIALSMLREQFDTSALSLLDIGVIGDDRPNGVARRAIELFSAGVTVVASSVSADGELVPESNRCRDMYPKAFLHTIIDHQKIESTPALKDTYAVWQDIIKTL